MAPSSSQIVTETDLASAVANTWPATVVTFTDKVLFVKKLYFSRIAWRECIYDEVDNIKTSNTETGFIAMKDSLAELTNYYKVVDDHDVGIANLESKFIAENTA